MDAIRHFMETKFRVALAACVALWLPLAAVRGATIGLLVEPAAKDITPETYWQRTIDFAQAAAGRLGVTLRVLHADGTAAGALKAVHQAARGEDPVQALLLWDFQDMAVSLAQVCEQTRTPYLFYGDPPLDDVFRQIQPPPSHRVASLFPAWHEAARDAMAALAAEARRRGTDMGRVEAVGVGVRRSGTVYTLQAEGLKEGAEASGATLQQFMYSSGGEEDAQRKVAALLFRYPQARVFFTGRQDITDGVLAALQERGLQAGKDILVAGVTLNAAHARDLQEGRLQVCISGDALGAGWGVVVLHDHLREPAPVPVPPRIPHRLYLVTPDTAPAFQWLADATDWKTLDLGIFSRKPGADYDFDLRRCLPTPATP